MPLTPHGGPGAPLGGLTPTAGLWLGGLLALGGLLLGLASPLEGLALGGFGLALVAWGQLMRDGPAAPLASKLWLGLGLAGGLAAFVSAFLLLR